MTYDGVVLANDPRTDGPTADGDEGTRDLVVGAGVVVVLVILGALLGLVWAPWSPAGPQAIIYPDGAILPDETESFVGADGRFFVIVAVVGLVAGFAAWRFARRRGVVMALALAVGGTLGSLATWLVGHLDGGGDGTGRRVTLDDGTVAHLTKQLPLDLQTHGLLFVEGAIAVLIYALFVAFTSRDDLGRPDPVRDRLLAQRAAEATPASFADQPSIHPGDQPQGGWGYGNASGAPQQGDLPPQ